MKTGLTFVFSCLLFIQFTFTQNDIRSDTLNLPFFEDWSSGDFETNGWTLSDENWIIDPDSGFMEPSAKIDFSLIDSEYNSSITSAVINASTSTIGEFWLDYDINLISIENTDTELFTVEIFDGLTWITVAEYSNDNGNYVWKHQHLHITSYASNRFFQIRFRAFGDNPELVGSWAIDNISLYRVCLEPWDLFIDYYWDETHNRDAEYGIQLSWYLHIHQPYIPPLKWSGDNFTSVGITDGGDFAVAARFYNPFFSKALDYDMLVLGIFLNDDEFDSIVGFISSGNNGEEVLWESKINSPETGDWFFIEIDTLFDVSAIDTLWIGYRVFGQDVGSHPAGVDEGPAIVGLGDLISTDGTTWDTASNLGLNYNWNLQLQFSFESDTIYGLPGFNIYRSEEDSENFEWYDFVELEYDVYDYKYLDPYPNVDNGKTYCYQVTSQWETETDTCESAPALNAEYPLEDFVCSLVTSKNESTINKEISVYPNPALYQVQINSSSTIHQLEIVNLLGQTIIKKVINAHKYLMNTSGLENGIYIFKIETDQGLVNKRVVISD